MPLYVMLLFWLNSDKFKQSIHILFDCILSLKGDKATSLAPVNDIVQHCYIPSIEAVLETKFTRESGSDKGQSPGGPGLSDETLDSLLLDKSKLQFIGLRTAYFKPQSQDDSTRSKTGFFFRNAGFFSEYF